MIKVSTLTLSNKKPDIRYLNELKSVLYDKAWAKKAKNFEVYFMFRGVKRKNGLRYDITLIPPKMLGKEFVKTKGHYHKGNFSEIYKVLEGKALYLMQKLKGGTENSIEDVYVVEAKKGDVVIIPPEYGHVTINPSRTQSLKMANWISEKCQSDYSLFEKMQGACYYFTQKGWIKNKNYKKVPKLRFEKPKNKMPKDLSFLKN